MIYRGSTVIHISKNHLVTDLSLLRGGWAEGHLVIGDGNPDEWGVVGGAYTLTRSQWWAWPFATEPPIYLRWVELADYFILSLNIYISADFTATTFLCGISKKHCHILACIACCHILACTVCCRVLACIVCCHILACTVCCRVLAWIVVQTDKHCDHFDHRQCQCIAQLDLFRA